MIKSEKNYNRNNYEYGNEVAGKVLSTDSYIEEVFYNKCIAKSVRNKLLLEWIDSKSIYISYTDLIKGDFGNYSRHDASHSVTILNAITSILGRERRQFKCYRFVDALTRSIWTRFWNAVYI